MRRARRSVTVVYRKAKKHSAMSFFKTLVHRPSVPIAGALAVGGLLTLIFNPLPNGDGIVQRITAAINSKGTNPMGADNPTSGSGNNVFSIAALQIQQNMWNAAPLFAGAVLVAYLGKKFKF